MNTNVILGILGAAVGVGAIAYATSASASTPASSASSSCANPPALPTGYTWQVVTGSLAPGAHVRISMSADNFSTVSQSLAGTSTPATGIAGWTALLATPQVAQVLGTNNICAWAPGDALPLDWPTDDLDAQSEYHADFVYQGTTALAASAFPFPASIWAATPPAPVTAGSLTSTSIKTTGPVVYPGQTLTATTPGSTNPQTAHLVAPGGEVDVTGTATGTPITVVIDGGGTFTNIAVGGEWWPSTALPTLPFFVYTSPGASGNVTIEWQDAGGTNYSSTLVYS